MFRRLISRGSDWRDESMQPAARWARYSADYQPVLDAVSLKDPEAEFERLVAEGHRLEEEYQRRSRGGVRDIDPADRLRGISYVSGVDDARRLRSLPDSALQAEVMKWVQLLRTSGPIEGPLVMAHLVLAEKRRRTGTGRLEMPSSLQDAQRIVDHPDVGAPTSRSAPETIEAISQLRTRLERVLALDLPADPIGPTPKWKMLRLANPTAPIVSISRDPRAGDRVTPVFFVAGREMTGSTPGWLLPIGNVAPLWHEVVGSDGLAYVVVPLMFHMIDDEVFRVQVTQALRQAESQGHLVWISEPCEVLINHNSVSYRNVLGPDGQRRVSRS